MTRKHLACIAVCIAFLACALLTWGRYSAAPVFSVTSLASTSARPFAGGVEIRLKGVAMYGTVETGTGLTRFIITDCKNDLKVETTRPLPHGFREGRNITLTGTLGADNIFRARKLKTHRSENCDAGMLQGGP